MFTSISGALVNTGDTTIIKDQGKVYRYKVGIAMAPSGDATRYCMRLQNMPEHTKTRFREYRISPPHTIRRKKVPELNKGAHVPAPQPRQILS